MKVSVYGFDPAVWGTVSDYLTIVVYIFTAVFVWKTFKSQLEVQKIQIRQLSIENFNYRLKILPKFELILGSFKDESTVDRLYYSSISLVLLLSNSIAKNVRMKLAKETTPSLKSLNIKVSKFLNIGDLGDIEMEIDERLINNKINRIDINFELTFDDLDDNTYNQKFVCIIRGKSIAMRTKSPLLLKQVDKTKWTD